jgi:hypothetical protein
MYRIERDGKGPYRQASMKDTKEITRDIDWISDDHPSPTSDFEHYNRKGVPEGVVFGTPTLSRLYFWFGRHRITRLLEMGFEIYRYEGEVTHGKSYKQSAIDTSKPHTKHLIKL